MSTPEKSVGVWWRVENLLVAGRRVSGETFAPNPHRALANVAARHARDFKVDVAAAVAGAFRDKYRRISVRIDKPNTGGNHGK